MARAVARYRIEADDSPATRSLRRVREGFQETAAAAGRLVSVVGGVAGIAGVGGFAAVAKNAIDAAVEVKRLSDQLGVTTEFLSEMRGVVRRTGGDYDALIEGTKTLAERVIELAEGAGTATDAFGLLGVNLSDFQGLNLEQQVLRLVEALSRLEAGTVRTAAAQALLGDDAQTFLRLADTGVDSIAALREEQVRLGNSLSQDVAENAERAAEALLRIQDVIEGFATSNALRLVEQVADTLADVIEGVRSARANPLDPLGAIARPTVQLGPALPGDAGLSFVRSEPLFQAMLDSQLRQERLLELQARQESGSVFGTWP